MIQGGEHVLPVLDILMRYLEAEGVRVVFGVPGGLLHPVFEAIDRHPEIRLIVTKHECGAAFMADGFARTSGRIAVCASTSGPGATNTLTGVSVAFADSVPMLVLTGQVPRRAIGKGAAQATGPEDMDIVAMFRPVTKYSAMVASPESLSHHLRRALRQALTGRPGPVHLNFPVDLWSHEVAESWFDPHSYRPATESFDRRAVQEAAEILLAAEYPTILCGSGVSVAGAEEHLRALAELLPARVATSPRAKGVFPEDHALSLGVLGYAGHRAAADTLLGDRVDVLLAAGASLNETTTSWNPKLRPVRSLLQLDIDTDLIGRNYPVDVALVGDAQTILVELVYHVHRLIRSGRSPASVWGSAPPLAREDDWFLEPELRRRSSAPLAPQFWRARLQERLPDDVILFSDVGGHMLFNIHEFCIRAGQRFIVNLGFASMGHGTAAPIGAALANPGRPVVAIIGDACFTMNGMDFITASEYDVPVIWIVESNNMHGITWHGAKVVGRSLDAVRYRRPLDVAGIGRAMGLRAWIVETADQIAPAFEEALASGGPAVIEVKVDSSIPPPLADRAQSVQSRAQDG